MRLGLLANAIELFSTSVTERKYSILLFTATLLPHVP